MGSSLNICKTPRLVGGKEPHVFAWRLSLQHYLLIELPWELLLVLCRWTFGGVTQLFDLIAQDSSDRKRRGKRCETGRNINLTLLARPNSQERTGTRETFMLFPVYLTTNRSMGNHARLMHTLLKMIMTTHMHMCENTPQRILHPFSLWTTTDGSWIRGCWLAVCSYLDISYGNNN